MASKIDYGTEMPKLVEAAHRDPETWHRAMWGTTGGNHGTQLDTSNDQQSHGPDERSETVLH